MEKDSLPVHHITTPVNVLTLSDSFWSAITTDWAGTLLGFSWEIFLACDEKRFHFFTRSSAPAELAPFARANTFTPNLWEYTVAEIFFFNKQTERYQEYNIAPNGAWWQASFSDYRTSTTTRSPEHLKIEPLSYRNNNFWVTGFSMPVQNINNPFSEENLLIQVCGISGHSKPQYIAWNSLPDADPDFHLRTLAVPIRSIEV